MKFQRLRWPLRIAGLAMVLMAVYPVQRWWGGNLGTIIPGRFHRSSQLDAGHLREVIRDREIRTVINLRGPNPDLAWYRAERAATLKAGATLVDLPLASDLWLSRAQAKALVETLDTVETPALIHCQWGAERTGLVAAIVQLLQPDGQLADAEREFSLHYLFARTEDGKVMSGHLDAYADWLETRGIHHTGARFRRWLLDEYRPLGPSREDWAFNPYPLVVVNRPACPDPKTIASQGEPAVAR